MARLAQSSAPPDGWQASGGAGEQRGRRARQHYSTRPADILLPRLEAVRETGDGRWSARCPAHDDRTPSLTIRETDDATLLVRCWAGCGAADVVAAVGLELSHLFPDRLTDRAPLRRGERWIPRDVLKAVAHEATIVVLAAEDLARGASLSERDHDRLTQAWHRLRAATSEVR